MLKIDLNDYVNIVKKRRGYSYHAKTETYPELGVRENGLKAAKDSQISKEAQNVDIIQLTLTEGIQIREVFLKAFLGPTARKLGPGVLINKIAVVGNPDLLFSIQNYLKEETRNIEKRAAKKKAEKEVAWSEPKQFFLPEISTRLSLIEDWEFTLHSEHRNTTLAEQCGLQNTTQSTYCYNFKPTKIKLLKGSELFVDRIYIRQGAKAFSSVTFRIKKGSRVEQGGKIYTTKAPRFWAKLHDVNQLRVKVDLNSVPGLEIE